MTLGVSPGGRAEAITAGGPLEPLPAGPLAVEDVVVRIAERRDAVAALAREHLEPLGDSDPVSQDLVIQFVAELEKQAWMMRPKS